MSELLEETQEKPVYEAPIIVDLNSIQRGEGGIPGCTDGSADVTLCLAGAGGII